VLNPKGIYTAKSALTTTKAALARSCDAKVADDHRAHLLRAASWKYERRLHDIRQAVFEAKAQARQDYLDEVAEIEGGEA
jgi:hypothetical protein